ncbi:nitrogen fixation protein NifZ [Azoarcus sp. L1K30]|uniref:nitrogen fixation protein NifZ n=1 Tax=Azoarcus sp. L1K30 TaxID=2820277 RepID=UPI001B83EA1D|nr:nitrogen fixation protein NifZ [Azoarcus sp. L1K30]MBR0566547.1 nitrogen fixation protein NifZ [Azoarcus sp. L1K30]
MGTPFCSPGDVVFAADALYNDGSIPDIEEGALLAAPGTRGVVVKVGHVEAIPEIDIILVRFEGADDVLGPPVGCLVEELSLEALATN